MAIYVSNVSQYWLDARHLMNDLANQLGAAVVVSAPEGSGFVVVAGDDIGDCEGVVGHHEILDSRIGG